MYLIDFDIIACVISAVSLYLFYTRKKIADVRSRRFEYLLWTVQVSAVFDLLSSIFINALPESGSSAVMIATTAYYVVHNSLPMLVALNVFTFLSHHLKRRGLKILFYSLDPVDCPHPWKYPAS